MASFSSSTAASVMKVSEMVASATAGVKAMRAASATCSAASVSCGQRSTSGAATRPIPAATASAVATRRPGRRRSHAAGADDQDTPGGVDRGLGNWEVVPGGCGSAR